jgi:hypothetical protein
MREDAEDRSLIVAALWEQRSSASSFSGNQSESVPFLENRNHRCGLATYLIEIKGGLKTAPQLP